MQKIEPSNKTLYLFLVMILGSYIAEVLFFFPYVFADGWFPLMTILFITSLTFFSLTTKT